jgi:hypothetical protein
LAGGQSSSLMHARDSQAPPSQLMAPVQRVHWVMQVASGAQLESEAHAGAQKRPPLASRTQCCGVPSTAMLQSWSAVHGAQYCRGRQTRSTCPKVRLVVVALGAWLTRAHHQLPGQSLSLSHPKRVQNAVASVGELP